MKFFRLLPAFLFLGALSCGESERQNVNGDSTSDTVTVANIDSMRDTIPEEIIATQLGGDTIVPTDKSLIFFRFTKNLADNEKKKPLPVKEVRKRFSPMDPECDQDAAWTYQRFFELDSLRKIGEEPDTDMGQTVTVEIREYDTIKKSSAGTWVAWTMFYETSQSCPYATGTYFMLTTYDAAGHIVSTQCMGRDCGGADAPLRWVSVQESNIFTDGSFRGVLSDTSGEDEFKVATDLSIMRKTFTGMVAPGGKITTVVKEIERND